MRLDTKFLASKSKPSWVCEWKKICSYTLKSVNIWQSYKQERSCLMHFAHLANTLLIDEESARDNQILACILAKYLPRLKKNYWQTQ